MSESQQLAIIPPSEYLLMKSDDPTAAGRLIQEQAGAAGLSMSDLDRIKVPAGGGLSWTIPGEIETTNTVFRGIIIASPDARARWEDPSKSIDGTPPICTSSNGLTGRGAPGGECATCPFNQYDSMPGKKGKWCKEGRVLFFLRDDNYLPTMLIVPPTSLAAVKRFLLRFAGANKPSYNCVAELTLVQDTNSEGVKYSKIVINSGQKLSPDEQSKVKDFAEAIEPALIRKAQTAIQADDNSGSSTGNSGTTFDAPPSAPAYPQSTAPAADAAPAAPTTTAAPASKATGTAPASKKPAKAPASDDGIPEMGAGASDKTAAAATAS